MFCDNHVKIKKKKKKGQEDLRFWSTQLFENMLLLSISRNSLQAPSSDNIFTENFTWSNSIILMEDLIRRKRGFEIFLIDHYASDIWNKNIAGT